MFENGIRDARLAKNISQVAIANHTGLSESAVIRIERNEGKTTPDEVKAVLKAIKEMPAKESKISGRQFGSTNGGAAKAAPAKATKAPAKSTAAKKLASALKK